jgi:PAS domain S-box-containing protein
MQLMHGQITRRLIFRITAPLVITMLILGGCLYLFNLRLISDFQKNQIAVSLTGFSHSINEICDRRFSDLLHRGLLSDEKALRIGKAETIGQIEDFMRKSQIGGRISTPDGNELLSYRLAGPLLQIVAKEESARSLSVSVISHAGQEYYLTAIDFEPWAWRIAVVKDAGQFASLKRSVRRVYLITSLVIMCATVLLVFSLNRVAQTPVAKIISDIRSGRKPQYHGIIEFEFLGDNIGKMMAALRQGEQALRDIADGLGEGVYVVDAKGRLLFLNKEAERLLGWKEADLLGRMVHGIFHGHENGIAVGGMECCPMLEVIRTGNVYRSEEDIFLCRDGSALPVAYVITALRKEGTNYGAVTAFQDITTRKRDEEERVRLVTAIEQAAEAVLISDRQMVIQYVNPAFERISGYTRDEVIGQPGKVLNSDRNPADAYEKIKQTLSRGEVWSGRLIERNKAGGFYVAEVTVSPVRDKKNSVINYVHIHRDITQEVRLEKELRKAQKMEAIGTLAGGIAHDFNNILTGIMGYTQLAVYKLADTSPIQRDLTAVMESAQRAADLVRHILTLSRRTEKDHIPMQLAPTVTEVLKLLRPTLPSFIHIQQEISLTDQEDIVLADPTQIHQILMNLCTNAAHAMRTRGGVLTVKLLDMEVDDKMAAQHPICRALHLSHGQRHGGWHGSGGDGTDFRSLLYHQAYGGRYGIGSFRGYGDRQKLRGSYPGQ